MCGASLEVVRVPNEHVTFAARRTVELHDDGPVDFGAAAKLTRKLEAGAREPLALQFAARFPIEHRLVPKVGNRHLLVLVEREVGDERAVRHDDHLALFELLDQRHEFRVIVERDHFIDERERTVEPLGVAIRDSERAEALVVSPFENLQRRMRA